MTAAAAGRESGRSVTAKEAEAGRSAAEAAGTAAGHKAQEEERRTAAGRRVAGIAVEEEALGCSRTAACALGEHVSSVAWWVYAILTAGDSLHRILPGGSCGTLGLGMPW